MLTNASLIAFTATTDVARARAFYKETLGLKLIVEEPFALVFDAGGTMLRIAKLELFQPLQYTVLGWNVDNIEEAIVRLGQKGVRFQKYPDLPQDERGICTFKNGDRVAWFQDPDGNTLSQTQFAF